MHKHTNNYKSYPVILYLWCW